MSALFALSRRQRFENYKQKFLSRDKNFENDRIYLTRKISGNRSAIVRVGRSCGNFKPASWPPRLDHFSMATLTIAKILALTASYGQADDQFRGIESHGLGQLRSQFFDRQLPPALLSERLDHIVLTLASARIQDRGA